MKKGQPGYDPLFKLRPFLDPLLKSFQKTYHPGREVSIDESMIGFKGRLSFIQYMPKKPTKWGMKAFVLADSKTGYTYNWRLYTGIHTLHCKHDIVCKLVQACTFSHSQMHPHPPHACIYIVHTPHTHTASFPGPIPSLSMLHFSCATLKSWGEPGDETTHTHTHTHTHY